MSHKHGFTTRLLMLERLFLITCPISNIVEQIANCGWDAGLLLTLLNDLHLLSKRY